MKTDKASSFERLDNFFKVISDEAPYWPTGKINSSLEIDRFKKGNNHNLSVDALSKN